LQALVPPFLYLLHIRTNLHTNIWFDAKQIHVEANIRFRANIRFKFSHTGEYSQKLQVNFTFKWIFACKYSHTSKYSLANIRYPGYILPEITYVGKPFTVVDTGDKSSAGVVDTGEQLIADVDDNGDKHSFTNISRISPRIFCKKFETAPMQYLGAQGTMFHEKNLKLKISCQTPFKGLWSGYLEGFLKLVSKFKGASSNFEFD
jgi:hypothetical protein